MNTIDLIHYVHNKQVLEVGGPSQLLNDLYPYVEKLDILNHPLSLQRHQQNGNANFKMFLGDATDEQHIVKIDGQYDVIISSHTLEHIANPIKALKLWHSKIKLGGYIINIVPNKNHCWDRDREFTTTEHLLDDFLNNTCESDMTHIHESACMRETKPDYYEQVGMSNDYRIIHHHCFCVDNLKTIHEHCLFNTEKCYIDNSDPLQLIYVGIKK